MSSSTRAAFTLFAIFVMVNSILGKDECVIRPKEKINNLTDKFNVFKPHCNERNVYDFFLSYPGIVCQYEPFIGQKKIYGVITYTLQQNNTVAYLSVICVHDQKRNEGIGRRLLVNWIITMRSIQTIKFAHAWVSDDNEASKHLLRSLGFEEKEARDETKEHKWVLVLKKDNSGASTSAQ
ncbi:acetyltransferase (GNAT) family domain-containing protein [Ditylenchus destructor]|nr:acetyltransferase (GNAT) family domain-containing protein [Ditylenchus destructor]